MKHTVLNTRPAKQAKSLTTALQQHHHHVIELPCLQIQFPPPTPQLITSIKEGCQADFIIFLSANAVHAVAPHWHPNSATVITIGPATAAAADFCTVHRIADTHTSRGLIHLLTSFKLKNKKITLFVGNQHSNELIDYCQTQDASVNVVTTYTAECPPALSPLALQQLASQQVTIIISTSFLSLTHLLTLIPPEQQHWVTNTHLIVVNHRMKKLAITCGWQIQYIHLSPDATTASLVNTTQEIIS